MLRWYQRKGQCPLARLLAIFSVLVTLLGGLTIVMIMMISVKIEVVMLIMIMKVMLIMMVMLVMMWHRDQHDDQHRDHDADSDHDHNDHGPVIILTRHWGYLKSVYRMQVASHLLCTRKINVNVIHSD